MSLSAYDIFSRIHGSDDDESEATNSSTEEGGNTVKTSARPSSELYDDVVLSSLDSVSFLSLSDSISMDSSVLQERGSLIALPPELAAGMGVAGYRVAYPSVTTSEDGERTILSSAPSGAAIPPPEANFDIFAISPHPRLIANGAQSLSTTRTDVLPVEHQWDDNESSNGVPNDLESVQSRNATRSTSIVCRRGNIDRSAQSGGHDAIAFQRVAEQMAGDSTSMNSSIRNWYNRFSESDWDNFRTAAKTVLSAIEPVAKYPPLLPLPPTPPQTALLRLGPSTGHYRQISYCAQDYLPNDFVCTICKDVIVGAVTLDCDCGSAMVCALCWEHGNKSDGISQCLSDQMGFVWVEKLSSRCPHCTGSVNSKVHCHALDVAILHIVNDMPELCDEVRCLKENYYSRLAAWRTTVYDLNETQSQRISAENDELLARLIAEEERVFWQHEKEGTRGESLSSNNSSVLFFVSQAAIAMIVATVVSIGLKAIPRR